MPKKELVHPSSPVTPENMASHPNTPPDMLHGQIRAGLAGDLGDYENTEKLQAMLRHPNVPQQALVDAFNTPGYDERHEVASHPNFPVEHAKQYLTETAGNDDWQHKVAHRMISDRTDIDPAFLESIAHQQVNDPKTKNVVGANLRPSYYMSLLRDRPMPEPEQGRMTDSQKATNLHVSKIDKLLYEELPKTRHHDQDSLGQTISMLTGQQPYGRNASDAHSALSDLIRHQPDLSPAHLNQVAGIQDDDVDYWRDPREEALKHKNVDPKTVAKFAASTTAPDNLRYAALSSERLPAKTRDAAIGKLQNDPEGRKNADALLQNPNLTSSEVDRIYTATGKGVKHPNMSEETLQHAAQSDKSAEGARNLLSRKDLSPAILSHLVSNHKNQNVVEEALKHPSVDRSVLDSALKRRATWAQQAAMRHPLIAQTALEQGLKSGTISPHDYLFDERNVKAHGGKISQEAIADMDQKLSHHSAEDADRIAGSEEELKAKGWMASNPAVPEDVREKHASELVDSFKRMPAESHESDPHGKEATKQVVKLSEGGNDKAQKAILNSAHALDRADLSKEGFGKGFLHQALEQSPDKAAEILRNPNVGMDTVRAMYSNNVDMPDRYFYDPDGGTLFDKRFADLSPTERDQEFGNMLASGNPQARQAFLDSRTAPKAQWNQEMVRNDPRENKEWFDRNELADYADDDTLRNALAGRIRVPANGDRWSTQAVPYLQTADALDPAKPEHAKMLADFLGSSASPINRHTDMNEFAEKLNSKFVSGPEGQALVEHAMRSNPTMGAHILGKALNVSEADPAAKLAQAESVMKAASATPEEYADKWHSMLSAANSGGEASDAVASMGVEGRRPSGKLDFLANLPGDHMGSVRQMALEQNLISAKTANSVAESDPSAFVSAMRSQELDNLTKQDRLADYTARMSGSAEANKAILDSMDAGALFGVDSHRRRGTMSDEQFEKGREIFQNVVGNTIQHPDARYSVAYAISNAMKGGERAGLTKPRKKELVSSAINAVRSSALDESSKLDILANIQDSLNSTDTSDLMPARLSRDIVEGALEQKNYKLLASMAKSPDAPAAVKNAVATALGDFESIDEEAAAALALSSYRDSSDVTKSRIMSSLATRTDGNPSGPASIAMNDICSSILADPGGDQGAQQNAFQHMTRLAYAGNPLSAEHMVKAMANCRSIPVDQRIQSFADAPDTLRVAPNTEMPAEIANNPQFLGAAKSGWKLGVAAASAGNLSRTSGAVIANRLVSSNDPNDAESRVAFASNAVNTDKPAEEAIERGDVTKVMRMLSLDQQAGALQNAASKMHDYSRPRPHYLVPHVLEKANAQMNAPEATPEDHTAAMDGLMVSARALAIHADQWSASDKEEVADQTSKVFDTILAYQNSGKLTHESENEILASLSAYSRGDLEKHPDGSSIRMVRVAAKLAEGSPAGLVKFNAERFLEAAEMSHDEWSEAFDAIPALKFATTGMRSIDPEIVKRANYNSMLDTDPQDAAAAAEHWVKIMEGEGTPEAIREIVSQTFGHEQIKGARTDHGNTVAEAAVRHAPAAFSKKDLEQLKSQIDSNDYHQVWSAALESGAGGQEFFNHYMREKDLTWGSAREFNNTFRRFADSPSISDQGVETLLDRASQTHGGEGDDMTSEVLGRLVDNKSISAKAMRRVSQAAIHASKDDKHVSHELMSGLLSHPAVDKQTFRQAYDATKDRYSDKFQVGREFNPAFTNSRFGGELFRELPVEVPKDMAKGIDQDNLVTKAEYSVGRERLNEALASIPPQGITWADFKKAQPAMQNWPEVKNLFMSKNNKPVLPEDFAKAVQDHEGGDFHVTYSQWDGAQRHSDAPNLVMQLNTSASMEQKLSQDPKLWSFFSYVQKCANHTGGNTIGGHPVTPHTASWVRIDKSGGKKGWIIEEFQSDFGARLHQEIDNIKSKTGQTDFKIDGFSYSPQEMKDYTNKIAEAISGWHMASLKATEELAKRNGVKHLYLHGSGVRAALSGMSASKSLPVWLQNMYDKIPRAESWEAVDYSSYPNVGKGGERAKQSGYKTQCWRKKL